MADSPHILTSATAIRRRLAVSADSPCPNEAEHTPCPTDYLGWWSWAERMNRTHGQRQCTACGRWAIWYPRAEGEFAPCWGCGEAKVDPALFGEDDELLCHGCQVGRRELNEAGARESLRRRWAETT